MNMVEITSKLKYYRMSPRKVRLVVDLVRGKKVKSALGQLSFLKKRSSDAIAKLLKSAVSDAKHNFKISSEENLYIKKITVDEGPTLKRFMPRARGTSSPIRKRTSHITVVLEEQPKKS
jgi:large subunit ribosomal protein L22